MPDPAAAPRVSVDRDVCMGTGLCIVYAPNTFEHDDDAKAVVQSEGRDDIGAIKAAVEACPTGALTLLTH